MLNILMRVRRSIRPERCLFIPQWIFDAADEEIPNTFRSWDEKGYMSPGTYPASHDDENVITVSHKEFSALQCRILYYYLFWIPEAHLRKAVDELEQNVRYSAKYMRSKVDVLNDTLYVTHYFFALQRRLRRKVVSDFS